MRVLSGHQLQRHPGFQSSVKCLLENDNGERWLLSSARADRTSCTSVALASMAVTTASWRSALFRRSLAYYHIRRGGRSRDGVLEFLAKTLLVPEVMIVNLLILPKWD